MMCQNCQKRPANVHFTKVTNDSKVELYLCEQCAAEKGKAGFGAPMGMGSFFSGLMGLNGVVPYSAGVEKPVVCERCGMSYEEFKKTGKMGCSHCYCVFGEKMNPVLKRLHGSTNHTGRVPSRLSNSVKVSKEIDHLKMLLNKAVQEEAYEKAAELRDRIRSLEVGL